MGYLTPSAEFDEAVAELRATLMAGTTHDDHIRLRTALPALDRPAPQGRRADRALPVADRRRGPGRRDPRRRLLVPHAQDRAGARRPAKRCARTACPPRSCAWTETIPPRRCAHSPRRSRRCCDLRRPPLRIKEMPDADRLRRARQDGRQHGRAHPPRLRPRGRRLRLRRAGGRARGRPARPAPPACARSSRQLEPPRTVWIMVPAGDPTQETVEALAKLLVAPTTRSSTAATRSGPTTRRRAKELRKAGINYVDVGISGGVWGLEVGYCMMVGGRPRSSSSRRSSTCSRPDRAEASPRSARAVAALRRLGRRGTT